MGWPDQTTAVYHFLDAVDLAMTQEGLNQDVRAAVVNRLIYGDRRGFLTGEEKAIDQESLNRLRSSGPDLDARP